MKRKPPKNPTPKPLLNIGDVVLVNATVTVYRDTDYEEDWFTHKGPLRRMLDRTEIAEETPMIVVGGRRRVLGEVMLASHSSDPEDYDPGGVNVSETVFVYQMREGFMRKIVEVLPQDVKPYPYG